MLKHYSVNSKEKSTVFKSIDALPSSSTQVPTHSKSTYEKIINAPEVFSHYQSVTENTDKQPGNFANLAAYKLTVPQIDPSEKHRSQSVDVHSKKKAAPGFNGSYFAKCCELNSIL